MKRVNHKCPGAYGKVDGYPGNCRNVTSAGGTYFCARHQDFCDTHSTAWMKSSKKGCPACLVVLQKEQDEKNHDSSPDKDGGSAKKNKDKSQDKEVDKTPKKKTAKGGRRVSKGGNRSGSGVTSGGE